MPCPTCQRGTRETVGMVCQTCGRDYGPPTPAPGGRTRDAREQIADVIVDAWRSAPPDARVLEMARRFADAVLAIPAVADALALRGRVRALAEEAEANAEACRNAERRRVYRFQAKRLRRALDGQP